MHKTIRVGLVALFREYYVFQVVLNIFVSNGPKITVLNMTLLICSFFN